MLPAILAIPWAVEACTALMILYVRYGPAVMAALTETPLPTSTVTRTVAQQGAHTVTPAVRSAVQAWFNKFSQYLPHLALRDAAEVVASTRANVHVYNQHLTTYAKHIDRPPAPRPPGVDITNQIGPRVAYNPADKFPMILKPLSSSRGADLLVRKGLRLEKHGDFWELKRGPAHVAYMPGHVRTADQFVNWLEDVIQRHRF